jgi:folate-binding protein YgfZ
MPPADTATTTPANASPLAAILAVSARAKEAEAACYRGVLTPCQLDGRQREIEALAFGAAVHDLGWMRRIAVRGNDRFRWLSGMVTNTVHDLPGNAGAWNLVLNAQGRIQGDLWVWRQDDELELEIAADQCEKLLAHLDHFIIMDDVELSALDNETAIGLTGPKTGEVLARVGLPVFDDPLTQARAEWNGFALRIRRSYGTLAPHYELWIPEPALKPLWEALLAAGARPVGTDALDAFRIAEGIPAYGIDMVERDLPQETSQMRALSFNKGCYLGQEIVERIRSRGAVHRHLRQLELTGSAPANDTELAIDGVPAEDGKSPGHITSAAELPLSAGTRVFALARMRAEAEAGDHTFTYASGPASGTARILAAPPTLNPDRNGTPQT